VRDRPIETCLTKRRLAGARRIEACRIGGRWIESRRGGAAPVRAAPDWVPAIGVSVIEVRVMEIA
jgi:hypothetical protein